MRIPIFVGAALVAGCGFVQATPRVGTGTPSDPGRIPTPRPGGGTLTPGVTDVANRRGVDGVTTRTLCRAEGIPRGFVVIDYVEAAVCSKGVDSTAFNAKIVEDIRRYPIGTTLRICRDQRIPDGWYPEYHDERTSQCPRSRGSAGSAAQVTTIDITKR